MEITNAQDIIEKHFVRFYSPGTFFAEISEREIPDWDIDQARAMADDITERYGARPYGFQFVTKARGPDDLDSHEAMRSPLHFINCRIETLDEIKARNDPEDRTLIRNMECNDWHKVAVTKSGWKWTQPIDESDIVIND